MISLKSVSVDSDEPIPAEPPDLIEGFLPRREVVILASDTNWGKTLTALEVAYTVISGTPLWGKLPLNGDPGPVLYILGEHNTRSIRRQWQECLGYQGNGQLRIVDPEQWVDRALVQGAAFRMDKIDTLKAWVKDGGYKLVVFDPLSAFVQGDENDNIVMRALVDAAKAATTGVGATCLFLAHFGKPPRDSKGHVIKGWDLARIRGASSTPHAASRIWYLLPADPEEPNPEYGTYWTVSLKKTKDATPMAYLLERDLVTLRQTLLTTTNRPSIQMRKNQLLKAFDTFSSDNPDLLKTEAVTQFCVLNNVGKSTLYRYLKERES